MEFKIVFAWLVLLILVVVGRANQITDCESEDFPSDYDFDDADDDSWKPYKSLNLYCGRPPQISFSRCESRLDYYDLCLYRVNYTCYHQIFGTQGKSKQVTQLKTNDCRGDRLNAQISKDLFPNLQTLDISNYGIGSLTSSDLQFRGLTKLNASHNKLAEISELLFVNTLLILDIDFSYNQITGLPANAFVKATTLKKISLAHNKIATIKPETFSSLAQLESLDLSGNVIETVHKEFFQNNKKLSTLKLQGNAIKRIGCNSFPSSTVLTVEISCAMAMELNVSCADYRVHIFSSSAFPYFKEPKLSIRCIAGGDNQLRYFNISQNYLRNAFELIDVLGTPIEVIDMSSNYVGWVNANHFRKFINLKYLDLRSTHLTAIDFPFARYNKKLRVLRLEENYIKRFDCNIFSVLLNSVALNVTWEYVREINTSCLKNAIGIFTADVIDEVVFRTKPSKSELRCDKRHFRQFNSVNVSTNQLSNAASLIELLGPVLETLDLSFNRVGRITARTFDRLPNLKYLNLSHTKLSNFQFSTFYHPRRLKMLDISYNRLLKVNFTLFLRNFKDLETLNLVGNELIEINSVTKTIFPKLKLLGISKNNFTCEYVVDFLHHWTHLKLMDNPTNQTHGIDCQPSQ